MPKFEQLRDKALIPVQTIEQKTISGDVITFLNDKLTALGLPRTIDVLTVPALPPIKDSDPPTHPPTELTVEQALAILYMAPGFKSVEIAALDEPVSYHEYAQSSGKRHEIDLVLTLEYVAEGDAERSEFINDEFITHKSRVVTSIWSVYGLDTAGNAVYLGEQM
jgi:hypothetical protein